MSPTEKPGLCWFLRRLSNPLCRRCPPCEHVGEALDPDTSKAQDRDRPVGWQSDFGLETECDTPRMVRDKLCGEEEEVWRSQASLLPPPHLSGCRSRGTRPWATTLTVAGGLGHHLYEQSDPRKQGRRVSWRSGPAWPSASGPPRLFNHATIRTPSPSGRSQAGAGGRRQWPGCIGRPQRPGLRVVICGR